MKCDEKENLHLEWDVLEYSEHIRWAYLQCKACLKLYTDMNKISVKYRFIIQPQNNSLS
jgi:hypothetical protein